MENTLENANKFIEAQSLFESGGIIEVESNELAALFVAYAATVRPDVVLPSRLDIVEYFKDTNFPDFYRGGANWMYDEIRRLNPELTFTESK